MLQQTVSTLYPFRFISFLSVPVSHFGFYNSPLQSEKMTLKINNKDIITEINSCKACEKLDTADLTTIVEKGANTWREDPETDGTSSP